MTWHYKKNVYRRLRDGSCVMKRTCRQCRKDFVGDRNVCPDCRNQRRRREWTKMKRYNRPRQPRQVNPLRESALAMQERRIHAEIEAIRRAGLDPDNDSIQTILNAGVVLS